jgi:hypothetical protein
MERGNLKTAAAEGESKKQDPAPDRLHRTIKKPASRPALKAKYA